MGWDTTQDREKAHMNQEPIKELVPSDALVEMVRCHSKLKEQATEVIMKGTEIHKAIEMSVMEDLGETVERVAATLGRDSSEVAETVAKIIDPPRDTPSMHSKKAEVEAKLSPAELEARREKRRHDELLAGFNRKQRRAYFSGRRAGLGEDEAILAIRARR